MPAALRKGSTGPDVVKWQTLVGVAADGKFGPMTEAATKDYQRANKLLPDGIVGPATWGVALGTSDGTKLPGGDVGSHMASEVKPPVSTPSAQNGDARAYAIAQRASFPLTEAERQYALTVARGEGGYGAAWGHPSAKTIELSQKFGLTGFEGKGSNNWGAEQGSGDAGSFRHVDHNAAGKPYVASYRRYSSPERGFEGFVRILFSGNKRREAGARELREAIARGALRDAVFAQHANGYFELAPERYLQAVLRNYAALSNNTGWSAVLSEAGASGMVAAVAKGGAGLAIAGAIGLGAFLWWRSR